MTNKNGHSIEIGDRYHLDFQRNRAVSFELVEVYGEGMAKVTIDGSDFLQVNVDSLECLEGDVA
jgi:hypothetical protein